MIKLWAYHWRNRFNVAALFEQHQNENLPIEQRLIIAACGFRYWMY